MTQEELTLEIQSYYHILVNELGYTLDLPFTPQFTKSSSNTLLYEAMEGDLVFYNTKIYEVIVYNFFNKNEKLVIAYADYIYTGNEIELNPKSVEVFPQECVYLVLSDYKEARNYYEDSSLFNEWLDRRRVDLKNRCNQVERNETIDYFYENNNRHSCLLRK